MEMTDGDITLRAWTATDLEALVDAVADPEIARWMPAIPYPYRRADGQTFLRRAIDREGTFAIVGADGRLLGGIAVNPRKWRRAEVGYWIRRDARGRGHASTALRLASGWALGRGYRRLQLHADVENLASQRVAEKAGYRREGVMRAWIEQDGVPRDHVMYSLLPSDR